MTSMLDLIAQGNQRAAREADIRRRAEVGGNISRTMARELLDSLDEARQLVNDYLIALNDARDLLSLDDAAALLGIAAVTLRHQVKVGRLRATLIGKTWVTTRRDVNNYRANHLDRLGRPPGVIETASSPEVRMTPTQVWSAEPELLTLDELATILRVSRRTVT